MKENSKWHLVSEILPPLDKKVIVLTKRGKITTNYTYIPKDCYGNPIDGCNKRWHGNHLLANSIVAWMEIPDFKDIIK